ncbi:hypothetical protein BDY21DRAFT_347425 [Lineolata rhizophorae]|uniref:Transmembrane protein n=1 Tax=Lineolata rhizophorae TaxID=578093 RepID=A0A6A6NZ30_9PEZI|nr:hypothetical protein BDY21DRAFT_347425 [Lineolata rhizophorae]
MSVVKNAWKRIQAGWEGLADGRLQMLRAPSTLFLLHLASLLPPGLLRSSSSFSVVSASRAAFGESGAFRLAVSISYSLLYYFFFPVFTYLPTYLPILAIFLVFFYRCRLCFLLPFCMGAPLRYHCLFIFYSVADHFRSLLACAFLKSLLASVDIAAQSNAKIFPPFRFDSKWFLEFGAFLFSVRLGLLLLRWIRGKKRMAVQPGS